VGYAGGRSAHPTYHDLDGHSETIEIVFDPARVSYGELLAIFWSEHAPTERTWSRQYANIIFTHGEEQRRLAEQSRTAVAERLGLPVATGIVEAGIFWPAEDYHQKHSLRATPDLARIYQAIYPGPAAFRDSTATARINGYLGGYGSAEALARELPALGLPPAAGEALLRLVRRRS